MKRKTILTIITTIIAILIFKTLRKETQSLAKSLKQQGTEEW
jgi:hypothetical protein